MRPFIEKNFPWLHTSTSGIYRVRQRQHAHDPSGETDVQSHVSVEEERLHSTLRGEEAVDRVAETLFKHRQLREDVVFFITDKNYKNLHCACADSTCGETLLKFPKTARHDPQLKRGDFDILLIHSLHGYILLEAVGDTLDTSGDEGRWLSETQGVIAKGVEQLTKGRRALTLLQPEGSPVNIVTTLALPNLRRDLLRRVLEETPPLQQKLAMCLRSSGSLDDVVSMCLCADDLPPKCGIVDIVGSESLLMSLDKWWGALLSNPDSPLMFDHDNFELTVESFCTGEECLSFPDAILRTAQRFQTLGLTEEQRKLLETEGDFVFVTGPPGSGKTLVLAHKAVQWLQSGADVEVYVIYRQGQSTSKPAAHVLHEVITRLLTSAPQGSCAPDGRCRLEVVLEDDWNVRRLMEKLTDGASSPQPTHAQSCAVPEARASRLVHCIVDEVNMRTDSQSILIRVLEEIRENVTGSQIWCAGTFQTHCPENFEVRMLSHPQRCPPKIQRLLKALEHFCVSDDDVLTSCYVISSSDVRMFPVGGATELPPCSRSAYDDHRSRLPSDGFDPVFLSHEGHGGEEGGEIYECGECADKLLDYFLGDMCLGQKALQPSDVLIAIAGTKPLVNRKMLRGCALYQRLTSSDRCELPVKVVEDNDDFDPQQKPAMSVMHVQNVAGMEKAVVVFVPARDYQNHPASQRECARHLEQCDVLTRDQKEKLSSLNKLNLHWLWYAASRSLAHLVVFHFGSRPVTQG